MRSTVLPTTVAVVRCRFLLRLNSLLAPSVCMVDRLRASPITVFRRTSRALIVSRRMGILRILLITGVSVGMIKIGEIQSP